MPYAPFATRVDFVDFDHASDVNVLNVQLGRTTYGVYNVREYGVAGDNTTDDRANLATADAACAASGGVLYFPPSAGYRIASNLTLASTLHVPLGASLNPATGVTLTLSGRLQLPFAQCFGGAGTIALGPLTVPALKPEWWGAKGDNSTDSTAAIRAAMAAAFVPALPFSLEFAGVYLLGTNASQIVNPGVHFRGVGMTRSVLRWNTVLTTGTAIVGTTIPSIIFTGDRDHSQCSNLTFYGQAVTFATPTSAPSIPAPSYGNVPVSAGSVTASDGIVAYGKLLIENCLWQGWNHGLIIANGPSGGQTGHATFRGCRGNSCYMNVYDYSDGGDTVVDDCDFTGANMASIGITGLALQGEGFLQNWICNHVHLGFAPACILQEAGGTGAGAAGPSGSFMVGCDFRAVEFESTGNAAILTLIPGAQTGNNKFEDVGFGWNPATYLSSLPSDYVCVLGNLIGYSHYRPAVNPFTRPPDGVGLGTRGTQGRRGVWYINNLGGGLKKQIVQNEPDYVAGTSGIGNIAIDLAGLTSGGISGWASGAVAGTASVAVTSSGYYLGPAAGLYPTVSLQGQSYPGLTNGGLGVGAVSSACVGPVASGPTATVGGAGNVNAGARQYYVVHRSNLGGANVGHTDSGPGSAVVNPGVASQVTLSNIPQGSSDVSAIELYRTASGNGGNPLLLVSLPALSIIAISVANPTVLQFSAAHGLVTGQKITISGSNSTPLVNGEYAVTVVDSTHVSIPVAVTGVGSVGGAFASSYTDNTADASLGAAVVHSDTSTGTQFLVYLTGSGTSSGQILFNWKLT